MRWQFLLYTLLTHFILFFTEFLNIKVSDECTRTLPRVLFNTEVQIYNRDDARSSRYFGIVLCYVSDADIAPLS